MPRQTWPDEGYVFISSPHLTESSPPSAVERVYGAVEEICASLGRPIMSSVGHEAMGLAWRDQIGVQIMRAAAVVAVVTEQNPRVAIEVRVASEGGVPCVLAVPAGDDLWVLEPQSPEYELRFETLEGLRQDLAGVLQLALKARELSQRSVESISGIAGAVRVVGDWLLAMIAQRPELLDQLPSRQFEELVAELFVAEGWDVDLTPRSRDGGFDLFAVHRDPGTSVKSAWIVECKKYAPNRKVGVEVVRALYGTEPVRNGANALLATTSSFTQGAQAFKASRYDLELRDRDELLAWLQQHRRDAGTNLLR